MKSYFSMREEILKFFKCRYVFQMLKWRIIYDRNDIKEGKMIGEQRFPLVKSFLSQFQNDHSNNLQTFLTLCIHCGLCFWQPLRLVDWIQPCSIRICQQQPYSFQISWRSGQRSRCIFRSGWNHRRSDCIELLVGLPIEWKLGIWIHHERLEHHRWYGAAGWWVWPSRL